MNTKIVRITVIIASWLFFLAAAAFRPAAAFVPTMTLTKNEKYRFQRDFTNDPLKMSEPEHDVVAEDGEDESTSTARLQDEQGKNSPSPLQMVVQGMEVVWYTAGSVAWYCVGGFGTASLCLNLIGYDYTFSREDGLNIDTIQRIREEKMILKQYKAYEKIEASIQPMSVITDTEIIHKV